MRRRIWSLFAVILVSVGGCATIGGSSGGAESAAEAPSGKESGGGESVGDPSAEASRESSGGGLEAPAGFSGVEVMNVFSTAKGSAVALTSGSKDSVVPIFVSQSQAMAIKLRLERRRYTRPLTHDLLDEMVEKLDGDISKVHIDAVKSGVFVGTVFVESRKGTLEFDARSSDAIALAVGNQVPIFVADGVFEEAGVPKEQFEGRGFDGGGEKMPSPEGEKPGGGGESGGDESTGEGPYF